MPHYASDYGFSIDGQLPNSNYRRYVDVVYYDADGNPHCGTLVEERDGLAYILDNETHNGDWYPAHLWRPDR